MHVIGIIFSVLGIGLTLRDLEWVIDSEMRQSVLANLAVAPLENQLLVVGALLFPFAYYSTCLFCCISKRRSLGSTVIIFVILCAAVPYYHFLHATLPGLTRNALWAGFFSIPAYFSRSIYIANREPHDGKTDHA